MTIESMQEFLVLAKIGNFQAAAESLYTSQATLSRHIMALEEELGVTLFERSVAKTGLTKQGMIFLPYARRAVEVYKAYYTELLRLQKQANGALSIAVMYDMNSYHIPQLLGGFIQQFPHIQLEITECSSDKFQEILSDAKYDFAFVQEPEYSNNGAYSSLRYTTDYVIAMLPPNHPLAQEKSIRVEQLKSERLLSPPKSSFIYKYTMNICQKAGFEPNLFLTGLSGRSLASLIEQGVGISLHLKKPATYMKCGAAIVDLSPPQKVNVDFLYPRTIMSESARAFYSYVRSFISLE